MIKVLVLYYSAYGHIERVSQPMAEEVARDIVRLTAGHPLRQAAPGPLQART